MTYEVDVVDVSSVPFAHIKRRGRQNQIGEFAMALLDTVWATVRQAGLQTGHNVFTYRAAGNGLLDMEFGVQVGAGATLPEGEVVIGSTPSGRTLHTLHLGSYDKLGEAWDAIYAEAARQGVSRNGVGWEVYGDWTDDLTKLETDVFILIK